MVTEKSENLLSVRLEFTQYYRENIGDVMFGMSETVTAETFGALAEETYVAAWRMRNQVLIHMRAHSRLMFDEDTIGGAFDENFHHDLYVTYTATGSDGSHTTGGHVESVQGLMSLIWDVVRDMHRDVANLLISQVHTSTGVQTYYSQYSVRNIFKEENFSDYRTPFQELLENSLRGTDFDKLTLLLAVETETVAVKPAKVKKKFWR
jgi:hypothetical protein